MSDANQWRTAAAKRAEAQRAAEPTALVTLPGFEDFPFMGRRVPWGEWFRNGLIPQSLANKLAAVHDGQLSEQIEDVLSGADAQAWVRLQQRLISAAVASPVIVFKEDQQLGPNEVYAWELPDGLLNAIFMWAMALSPDVPVMTEGGSTTLAEVETFHDNAMGQKQPVCAGAPLPDVRPESSTAGGHS